MENEEQRPSWAEMVSDRVEVVATGEVKVVPLAPKPRYVPVAAEKPAELSPAAIENCKKKIAARGFPNGFRSKEQFEECMAELYALLQARGIPVKAVGVRGMAATYKSANPDRVGHHFDRNGSRSSDVDAFFATESLLRVDARPNRAGILLPSDVAAAFPEIGDWSVRWTATLRRPVSAAAFTSLEALKELYVPFAITHAQPVGAPA